MARKAHTQYSFSAGQVSPHLSGRYNFPLYENGVSRGTNVIARPQGGFTRRPGSRKVYTGQPSSRIIPFQQSETNGFQVVLQPDGDIVILSYDSAIQTLSSALGAGPGAIVVQDIDYVQIRQSIILVHRSFAPKELIRNSSGLWSIVTYSIKDGPWESLNLDNKLQVRVVGGTSGDDGITGTCTLDARNKAGNAKAWFSDTWNGRKMRLKQTSGGEVAQANATITSVATTSQTFNATLDTNYPAIVNGATSDTKNWRLSAWYADNYPNRVGVYKDRLWFARDNWIWSTVSGDFDTFSPDLPLLDDTDWIVTDDSAIVLQGIDPKSTSPSFLYGDKVMHYATNANHNIIQGSNAFGPVTPTNAAIIKQSDIGAASIKPVMLSDLYFVDASRQAIYKSAYQFQKNGYISEKINIFDDEIFYDRILKIDVASAPWQMIFAVLESGKVICITINEIDSLYAPTVWEFYNTSVTTAVKIIDICVTRHTDNRQVVHLMDESGNVLLLGQIRTNAGATYPRLTYSASIVSGPDTFHTYSNQKDAEFLTDYATTYSSGSINLNSIASYQVVVDHGTYENYKYSSVAKTVTPDNTYEKGTPFSVDIITNKMVNRSSAETDLHLNKKAVRVGFDVYRTLDFKARVITGNGTSPWHEVQFATLASAFDEPPAVSTGLKWQEMIVDADEAVQIQIQQGLSVPFTLNSITIDYEADNSR